MKINEDVLLILKYLPNSSLVTIDYEPILKTLERDFEILKNRFMNPRINAKEIVFYIKFHSKLKILFETYDYCEKLEGSYQGLYESFEIIERTYPSNFNQKSEQYETLIKAEKDKLLLDCQNRLLAYHLKITYKKCEDSEGIIAYSHRKVGWSTPKYSLNDTFTVEFKTNFGYGYVSYFYTKISYKQFEIVSFADWVEYHNAKIYEVILYSSKHLLKNDAWQEAMEYVKNAYNLAITDDVEFITKYIISECDRLIAGLEKINNSSEFKLNAYNFLNQEREYINLKLEGHNLVDFRGEKITGSLNLIKIIKQFEEVVDIYKYISKIEELNKKILPIIVEEESVISIRIKELKQELRVLMPEYNRLKKKEEFHNLKKANLRQSLIKTGKLDVRNFDQDFFAQEFLSQNEEYTSFTNELSRITKLFDALVSKIAYLERLQSNFNNYLKLIRTYFN